MCLASSSRRFCPKNNKQEPTLSQIVSSSFYKATNSMKIENKNPTKTSLLLQPKLKIESSKDEINYPIFLPWGRNLGFGSHRVQGWGWGVEQGNNCTLQFLRILFRSRSAFLCCLLWDFSSSHSFPQKSLSLAALLWLNTCSLLGSITHMYLYVGNS